MLALFFALGRFWRAFCASCCFCGRSCAFLGSFGSLWARFWSDLGSILAGIGHPRHYFSRFFGAGLLSLPTCSECNKTTILLGPNTLRKQRARRKKRQKIASRALRIQRCTRKRSLGRSGVLLGRFGVALGRSWGALGSLLGALGAQEASSGTILGAF